MTPISRRIFVFSVIFFLFFFAFPLSILGAIPFFPLLEMGDLVEFVSPLFVTPAYWYLFEGLGSGNKTRYQAFGFILLTTFLTMCNGLHLGGNSIQHLLRDASGTRAFDLAYFFHKPFSHYTMTFALLGLSVLLIYREWSTGKRTAFQMPVLLLSALFYGFSFFCFTVSGKSTPLVIPVAGTVLAVAAWHWNRLHKQPIFCFFSAGYLIVFVFYAIWAFHWNGLPNFDEVGFIK